ncbi:hypothetical protein ADUPG1_007925 [Aduncisulcus paluster]|uniref:Palmitoyltransferase n=1 Tax=Aduncisulcus paluster TaxID=2918883 RepID=A0ABQ5KRH8_9EUKA|nr:hypothetical protein ADUPG1_007925 [Aduncisulcus paluster]|eukprot:gnl/Carplike_NY0171/5014_a6839_277.p1 GENE.gnl/Carplike_NY0171/5014_a6839_277~~gnl/Carplike_NY0171/5014_a6839_277.p1  ORF type:complete len:404 (-),score=27.35 gnl/Carplike_NY0171/5014_a6839_277:73-1284(-)
MSKFTVAPQEDIEKPHVCNRPCYPKIRKEKDCDDKCCPICTVVFVIILILWLIIAGCIFGVPYISNSKVTTGILYFITIYAGGAALVNYLFTWLTDPGTPPHASTMMREFINPKDETASTGEDNPVAIESRVIPHAEQQANEHAMTTLLSDDHDPALPSNSDKPPPGSSPNEIIHGSAGPKHKNGMYSSSIFEDEEVDFPAKFGRYPVCEKCKRLRADRTHHCRTCGKCCYVFDHHCVWVGNCVGLMNYGYFYRFLFWSVIGCIWVTVIVFLPLILCSSNEDLPQCEGYNYTFILFVEMFSIGLSLSIGMLCCSHSSYLCSNSTTLETLARQRKKRLQQRGAMTDEEYYDLGCQGNVKVSLGKYWFLTFMVPFIPVIYDDRLMNLYRVELDSFKRRGDPTISA